MTLKEFLLKEDQSDAIVGVEAYKTVDGTIFIDLYKKDANNNKSPNGSVYKYSLKKDILSLVKGTPVGPSHLDQILKMVKENYSKIKENKIPLDLEWGSGMDRKVTINPD